METKGERREQKQKKARYGHKVSGRSVFVIDHAVFKRAQAVVNKTTKA